MQEEDSIVSQFSQRASSKLGVSTELTKEKKRDPVFNQLENLKKFEDSYTCKIIVEQQRLEDLNRQCDLLRQEITGIRNEIPNPPDIATIASRNARQERILENKRRNLSIKLNTMLTENSQLKDNINEQRNEKLRSKRKIAELTSQVNRKESDLAVTLNDKAATQAAIDQAQRDILDLQREIKTEIEFFDQQWIEDVQTMEETKTTLTDNQLASAVNEEMKDQKSCRLLSDSELFELQNLCQSLFWKVVEAGNQLKKQMKDVNEYSARLFDYCCRYQKAYNSITKSAEYTSDSAIIRTMTVFEETNFAAVQRISELTGEFQKLEIQCTQLKKQISEVMSSTQGSTEGLYRRQRREILTQLESDLKECTLQAESLQKEHSELQHHIALLLAPVKRLFDEVKCSDQVLIQEIVGAGVSEGNLLDIMTSIEERILELSHLYDLYKDGQLNEFMEQWRAAQDGQETAFQAKPRVVIRSHHESPSKGGCRAEAADLPSISQFDDDESIVGNGPSVSEMPLTMESIRQMTEQRFQNIGRSSGDHSNPSCKRVSNNSVASDSYSPMTPMTPTRRHVLSRKPLEVTYSNLISSPSSANGGDPSITGQDAGANPDSLGSNTHRNSALQLNFIADMMKLEPGHAEEEI